jgi:hypothetical protein
MRLSSYPEHCADKRRAAPEPQERRAHAGGAERRRERAERVAAERRVEQRPRHAGD